VRSETIARTETANAYNYGKLTNAQAFEASTDDWTIVKTWTPTQDERTRDAHRAGAIRNRAGQVTQSVPVDEPFIVDGEAMMRPLDDNVGNTSAGNIIRCRCVMTMDARET
jgi:DNA-binding transcriptional regulator PaaX